jgi:hypothetical protein
VAEGMVLHSDAGSQYTAFAFTARLLDAGVDASVGSVGDAYDNALCESQIGLYKTELIDRRGPWKTIEQVELATLEWVDWFNQRRLHEACGKLPPAEYERSFLQGTLPAAGEQDGSPAATSRKASDRLTIARIRAERQEMAGEGAQSLPASLPRAGDGGTGDEHVDGALALGCEAPESFETTQRTQTNRSP